MWRFVEKGETDLSETGIRTAKVRWRVACTARTLPGPSLPALFLGHLKHTTAAEVYEVDNTRPTSLGEASKTELQIEKSGHQNSNLNLPTIKNVFLWLFVSYRSVTYLETDLSAVLELLGHTGHVGMLG